MKQLAMSNIAWRIEEDKEVAGILRGLGFAGVEVAPTKYWPKPLSATPTQIREVRQFWGDHGLSVVAMQALLFGRPDLKVFGTEATRAETVAYLAGICDVARELGAKVLVFGSPGNRRTDEVAQAEIEPIAVDFFRRVGEAANQRGVCVCIEANPVAYGCNFVTTSVEGLDLVAKVHHPGFGFHLDTGGLALSEEPLEAAVRSAGNRIRHVHASEPHLKGLPAEVDHLIVARTLKDLTYSGWVSIEMRGEQESSNVENVRRAASFVASTYASVFE